MRHICKEMCFIHLIGMRFSVVHGEHKLALTRTKWVFCKMSFEDLYQNNLLSNKFNIAVHKHRNIKNTTGCIYMADEF